MFVILGGMGSLATEDLVRKINSATDVKSDQDYLDYLVYNHASIPDRTEYLLGESENNPFQKLSEDVLMLEKLNPNFFVIGCNTAHYFHNDLQQLTKIPILNMPAITLRNIENTSENKEINVCILGTLGTVKMRVYEKCALESFNRTNIQYLEEYHQEKITELIYSIKKGVSTKVDSFKKLLVDIQKYYSSDYIVLACTELSILYQAVDSLDYVIDAQSELVREIIKIS